MANQHRSNFMPALPVRPSFSEIPLQNIDPSLHLPLPVLHGCASDWLWILLHTHSAFPDSPHGLWKLDIDKNRAGLSTRDYNNDWMRKGTGGRNSSSWSWGRILKDGFLTFSLILLGFSSFSSQEELLSELFLLRWCQQKDIVVANVLFTLAQAYAWDRKLFQNQEQSCLDEKKKPDMRAGRGEVDSGHRQAAGKQSEVISKWHLSGFYRQKDGPCLFS